MTYSKKYGKYGIYTDGMLYRWFKTIGNAEQVWNEQFAKPECATEWLEEYSEIYLIDMQTGELIHMLTNNTVL